MSGEVAILYRSGEEMVCGSAKGRLGHISTSLFEDLDLSDTLKIVQVQRGTPVWKEAHFRSPLLTAVDAKMSLSPSVSFDEVMVPLEQRYSTGSMLIVAGYSPRSETWYFWTGEYDVR